MIEIIAIDNQTAQADLLRLAASFLESRLFSKKQQKQLHLTVEVTGAQPPRPVRREQLAKKPGLFKSAKYQYDCAVNVAQGFEIALAQFTHELAHISQIMHNRYEIALKTVKKEGQKQKLYHAKWLGKKCGVIDDMIWESRPWESEAVLISQQLATEFFALINGQQSHFQAQGKKKDFILHEVQLSMPPIPQAAPVSPAAPVMTNDAMSPQAAPMPQPPQADFPQAQPSMPEPPMPEPQNVPAPEMPAHQEIGSVEMGDDELAALIAAPDDASFDISAPSFAAPAAPAEDLADNLADDMDLISELAHQGMDGVPNETPPSAFQPQPDMTAMMDAPNAQNLSGVPQPTLPAENVAAENIAANNLSADKEVYVQGVALPRTLLKASLEAKKQELARKGLLK